MNDEEKKKIESNINNETKEAIAKQIDSFINSTEKTKSNPDAISYYSNQKTEKEPLIKVSDMKIPEQEKQDRPIIRTYKSDVEETIQGDHISSISIAMAENRKKLDPSKTTDIEDKKIKINKNILIISIILVLGGALIFLVPKFLVQIEFTEKPVVEENVSADSLIIVDLEEKINIQDLNLDRVGTTLKERVNQSATKLGQIKNIYLTEGEGTSEKLIISSKFLELIKATIPSEISRTLKTPYMFGMHNYNGNQRFLILKVGSYDTSFSGMLYWEANLWNDFKELFDLKSDDTLSQSNPYIIETKKFQDTTYDNKDCRVVKDSDNKIVFLYSIVDENTIVITTSIDTFREINSRISKSRIITQ